MLTQLTQLKQLIKLAQTAFKNFFQNSEILPKILKSERGIAFLAPILWTLGPTLAAWVTYDLFTGGDLATKIALAIFVLLFDIIGSICAFFAMFSSRLLQYVLSPDFTTLSYTNPAGNEIIKIGLNITQDFVNVFLVLVLIYIALAVVLRIKEYEIQKLLPVFIGVALLVNFAPVFVGLIVDASNIVMNFFVADLDEFISPADQVGKIWEDFSLFVKKTKDAKAALAQSVFFSIYALSLAIALFVYAFIFLLRYVVIWVLVILSPLAFVSYILPWTRSLIFNRWWSQLLQWSFIGAIAGFFLYLGTHLMTGAYFPTPEDTGLDQSLNAIFPGLVSVVFLVIGIFFGMSSSAIGASAVINLAKTKGPGAGKWVASGVATTVAGGIEGWKGKEGIKGRAAGVISGAFTRPGREQGRKLWEKSLEKAHILRPGTYEARRRERWGIGDEIKRLGEVPKSELHDIVKRPALWASDIKSQMAAIELLAEKQDLTDFEKHKISELEGFGLDAGKCYKARPDWIADSETKRNKVMGTSSGDFVKNVQTEALEDIGVFTSLDLSKIEAFEKHGSASQIDVLKKMAADKNKKIREIIENHRNNKNNEEADRIIELLNSIKTSFKLRHKKK